MDSDAREWAVRGWMTALSWIFDRKGHLSWPVEAGTAEPALAALSAEGDDEGFSEAPKWLRDAVINRLEAAVRTGA